MAKATRRDKFIPTEFSVSRIQEGVVEVRMFDVTYQHESKEGYANLEVYKDKKLLEKSNMTRDGTEVRVFQQDESGTTAEWIVREDGEQVSTTVKLGEKSFDIRSDRRSHGIELAEVLRGKNGPSMQHIRRFSGQYTRNQEFRRALTEQGARMANGGLGAACGFACACCLIVTAKTPLCCGLCAACFLAPEG